MYRQKNFYGMMPRAIGGFMEDVLNANLNRMNEDCGCAIPSGATPVNIQETDKHYELHVVAPGLNKEDFKINVDRNTLHVSYEHKDENKEQNGKWIHTEYRNRSFKRSFTLSEKIDASNISAKYTDGVLCVVLPKKESAEVTAQEIAVA
jgi:HSP20 family protein